MLPHRSFFARTTMQANRARGPGNGLDVDFNPNIVEEVSPMPTATGVTFEIHRMEYSPFTDECCYWFKITKPIDLAANNVIITLNGVPLWLSNFQPLWKTNLDWDEWIFTSAQFCIKKGEGPKNLTWVLGNQFAPEGGYENEVVDSGAVILDCEEDRCCEQLKVTRDSYTGPDGKCCTTIILDPETADCVDTYEFRVPNGGPQVGLSTAIPANHKIEHCGEDLDVTFFKNDPGQGELAFCTFRISEIEHRPLDCSEIEIKFHSFLKGLEDDFPDGRRWDDRGDKPIDVETGQAVHCFYQITVSAKDKCRSVENVYGYTIVEDYKNKVYPDGSRNYIWDEDEETSHHFQDTPLKENNLDFRSGAFGLKQLQQDARKTHKILVYLLGKDGVRICDEPFYMHLTWDGRCWRDSRDT